MTKMLVRIELHGTGANYNELHQWMGQTGFLRTIQADDGSYSKLPTAMYSIDYDGEYTALRDWLAKNMPNFGSAPPPWILVINWQSCAWRLSDA